MTIISKELEIQDRLSSIYETLIKEKEVVRQDLAKTRHNYKKVCDKHILSGFQSEMEWIEASHLHQQKFLEYDTHCYLIDILSDYRDIEGYFPEYIHMLANIEMVMFKFAKEERYEVSAIIKLWLNKFIYAL
ncbi:hypothetical protein [Sphingobacterium sp. LRF_L2]|uniref:hypothetical protein n=1 Tax=Sphingobacterium sp. LRF_L2 TaxID=3369421 RepID=UPI003F6486F8